MAIRVVALMEASTVTGPAKNLIRFCRMAKADEAGDVSVSIAAFHRNGQGEAFLDAVRAAGIELDIIPERRRFDRTVLPAIAGIIERRRAGIIQTHAVKSHFLVRCAGFHRRCGWIAFQHGYTAEDLKMRLYIQLDRWSLRAADRVVTVCRPFSDTLVRIGVDRKRIQVVPNSIETPRLASKEEISGLRRRLGIPEGVPVILSVGRFSKEKGQVDLLTAMRLLARDHPELRARLILVGDGMERSRLEREAQSSGLAGNVIVAGHQANIWPFYGLADLFALPSHSEGSPNVLLEAMAAGVPIVATAVGGVPETVEDGSSALLVPARQPAALSAAIARVLENPSLAGNLAGVASEQVKKSFSPQAHYQTLLALYHEMSRLTQSAPQ